MMRFPDEVQDDVQKRLRRVEGQIRGIQTMLAEGKDCREVVTQLSAAKGALDRIGYRLVSASMRYCVANEGDPESLSTEELEDLFIRIS